MEQLFSVTQESVSHSVLGGRSVKTRNRRFSKFTLYVKRNILFYVFSKYILSVICSHMTVMSSQYLGFEANNLGLQYKQHLYQNLYSLTGAHIRLITFQTIVKNVIMYTSLLKYS